MKERKLIVGAGFTGSTIARVLADHGVPSRVVDRRHCIAENAYDPDQKHPNIVRAWESPKPHLPQEPEPYYPIPTESFRDLYKAYVLLASEVLPQLLPVGRLADYPYYNMDQAVSGALNVASQFISARAQL